MQLFSAGPSIRDKVLRKRGLDGDFFWPQKHKKKPPLIRSNNAPSIIMLTYCGMKGFNYKKLVKWENFFEKIKVAAVKGL